MDEPAAMKGAAVVQSLLQGIEHEAGMRRPADPPADDAAGIGVDHEGHVSIGIQKGPRIGVQKGPS